MVIGYLCYKYSVFVCFFVGMRALRRSFRPANIAAYWPMIGQVFFHSDGITKTTQFIPIQFVSLFHRKHFDRCVIGIVHRIIDDIIQLIN